MFLIITIAAVLLYLKGYKYYGLLCLVFLLTDGFQIVPPKVMLFGLNLYGKDYALVFSLSILLSYLITGRIRFPHKTSIFWAIASFLIYLIIAAAVDLACFNPSFAGFLLIIRVNFFLLTFFWLSHVEISVWNRLFKAILIITVLQSCLCLLQIPLGVKLLTQGGISEFHQLGFTWIRYTNTPYFILPCLYVLLLSKQIKIPYKGLVIVLLLLVIFFTLTRTLILGLGLTILFSVFLGLFKNQKKMLGGFILVFLLALPLIGGRIMSSTEDLNSAVTETDVKEGSNLTFTYRIFHMTERLLYIGQTTKGQIFGIGFIHEKDFPANTFLLGHKDDNGRVVQLEQDDISWSNLFLRFGIYGTILYLFIFVAFLSFFLKHKANPIAGAAIMYLIISIILSMASGKFSQADFYLIPMAMFFYIEKSGHSSNLRIY